MRRSAYICVWLLLFLSLGACWGNKYDLEGLHIAKEELNDVPVSGGSYKILVTSDKIWSVAASDSWLRADRVEKGITRTLVTINVDPNLLDQPRSGNIVFTTENETKQITVNQIAGEIQIDQVQYSLPIIFHVLYSDNTQLEDRPRSEEIEAMLLGVNKLYKPVHDLSFGEPQEADALKQPRTPGDNVRPNMNIDFVLATKKPDGTALSSPGMNAVKVDDAEVIYTQVLLDKKGGIYHSLLWDPSQYINVFIFKFEKDAGSSTTANEIVMGAAFLPQLISSQSGNGFDAYSDAFMDQYTRAIVLNSMLFYKEKETERPLYNPSATLAHELGHYLGLYHTFAEDDKHTNMINDCKDSDYCDDTPSYNRVTYTEKLALYGTSINHLQYDELLQRISCDQKRFYSTNIMDYSLSHQDMFTLQQRERIRKALYFSPMVPGIKLYKKDELRSTSDQEVIPPVIMSCGAACSRLKCTSHSHSH